MKRIRFDKVVLSQWRGQSMTVPMTGHTVIEGRNGCGKTKIWDAILWCLTGYDSYDRLNYRLFDDTAEHTPESSMPATVELSMDIDGTQYRLSRTAKMGWVRKRGSSNYEKKQSDDYEFEIDGVSVTSTAYREFVENSLAPMDKLKLMLNVDYFLMLDWKEMRKNLADIIGDVGTDEYEGDFSDVTRLISKYGSADYAREHLKSSLRPMRAAIGNNDTEGTLNVEKETLSSMLPDISGYETAKGRLPEIKEELSRIDKDISDRSETIKAAVKARSDALMKTANRRGKLSRSEMEYNEVQLGKEREILSEIEGIDARNRRIASDNKLILDEHVRMKEKLADMERRYEAMTSDLERRRERLSQLKSLVFTDDKCPYCSQPLPDAMLDEARERFNRKKNEDYERMVAEGKKAKSDADRCSEEIARLKAAIESFDCTPRPFLSKEEMESRLREVRASFIPYKETEEYRTAMAEISRMEAEIPPMQTVDISDLEKAKQLLYAERDSCVLEIDNKEKHDRICERIAAVDDEIRKTAAELARTEGLIASLDEMERQKAEIIRHRISSMFKYCDVRMEERKKDGAMTQSCSIFVDGVLVQVANTASRIHAGIDISNAFCRHYGVSLPLIVDNRERIDSGHDITVSAEGRQTIEMVRADCALTIK